MAEADPSAPVLNLTPDEKRVFGQLFRKADPDNVGVVTGDVAVTFFEKTRLDSRVLGEIWQLADKENRGFLTPPGFGIVLRLIGHAQAGREPSAELALQPGPLPRFDGLGPLPNAGPMSGPGLGSMQQPTIAPPPPAAPLQAQHTAAGPMPVRIPPLSPDKVSQFTGLFESQPLQPGGLLSGDQARQIFEKSGLPNEILGRIWQLADIEQRGSLNNTEFVIAMHLLSSLKTGAMRGLPNILPPGLFEAASRRSSVTAVSAAHQSPMSTGTGPMAMPMQVQMTGASPLRPSATGQRPTTATAALQAQSTGFGGMAMANDWLVTPADKQRFDQFYDDLDKTRRGYITGEEAVPFFSQSGLSEDVLAQVWDLSDITATGGLTRDEFSVAMYLIRQQRGGRGGPMPTTLPPRLIPPSMRAAVRPTTASASPFDGQMSMGSPMAAPMAAPAAVSLPPPPAPKSALDDLFGLDSGPASPKPAPAPSAPEALSDPFSSAPALAPSTAASPPLFKPFVPSSSFGRGLAGDAKGPAPAPAPAPSNDDLLGDADPDMSSKLNNDSTELANLSNQISSLSTQMQNTTIQRNTTQNELTQASSQKQNFEQRLAQLRSVYEKEAQNLRGLEEQLKIARSETAKLQGECMTLDGTFQDLQTQKAQVTAALQADQQENAALKEKIRALNGEIAQLKPQIEKLRLDARQQKGLVAINKKQLATNEGERDKLKAEASDLTKSIDEARIERSATGTPASARPQSPASSSGNNPFFKRSASTDVMGAFSSPAGSVSASKPFPDTSFDDIFGAAAPAAAAAAAAVPAVAAFQHQTTGNSTASVGSGPFAAKTESPAPPPGAFPFAEPADVSKAMTPRQMSPALSRAGDEARSVTSQAAISSVFPTAVTSLSTSNSPAATGSPFAAPASTGSPAPAAMFPPPSEAPAPTATATAASADPFAGMDSADEHDKAKADFESAFASFKKNHKYVEPSAPADMSKAFGAATAGAAAGAATATASASKFNSEFPPLEEFDVDESDSDSDAGFDDDFAPSSPKGKASEGVSIAATTAAAPTSASPFDTFTPAAPAPAAAAGSSNTDMFGASPFDAPSPAPAAAVPATPTPATAASASKTPSFDDLDDDFEGLEDAKEGSAIDDDFASISRSGVDDFAHSFDSSPAPAAGGQPALTAAHSDSTAFGGSGGSFDFVSGGGGGSSAAVTAGSQDWETIFSGTEGGVPISAPAPAPAAAAAATAEPATAPASSSPAPAAAAAAAAPAPAPVSTGDVALDNLMMMGYNKDAAMRALERYDHNLERAANYLANNS